MPVSYLAFIVLNSLKSNWHLAASCLFNFKALSNRIGIWLPVANQFTKIGISIWPFAGFLSSFYCFKPSQIELASGCQFTQTGELASGCRLPVSFLVFIASGCRLPVSYLAFIVLNPLSIEFCQFTQTGELASGCHFELASGCPSCQFANSLAFIVLNPLKCANRHLAAVCKVPRMCESASGCRLQSSYSTSIVLSSLKSNWHLAASCLPIQKRLSIWLPFAGFLSSFYCFKPSQIESASGC